MLMLINDLMVLRAIKSVRVKARRLKFKNQSNRYKYYIHKFIHSSHFPFSSISSSLYVKAFVGLLTWHVWHFSVLKSPLHLPLQLLHQRGLLYFLFFLHLVFLLLLLTLLLYILLSVFIFMILGNKECHLHILCSSSIK